MLETIGNIVSGIGSLIDTIVNFFTSVLTFLGVMVNGIIYTFTVLSYVLSSGGIFTTIVSLTPVFLFPYLLLTIVKAVLRIVK